MKLTPKKNKAIIRSMNKEQIPEEDPGAIEKGLRLKLKNNPLDEQAYHRLMVNYRKQKEYKKELAVIDEGIKAFEQSHKSSIKNKPNRKVTLLSRSLLKSLGLANKKGEGIFQPEPIAKWTRRKENLIKRFLNRKKK